MTSMTITEALAEIKTIGKRIEKKREFIIQYLARQDSLRDPLEKEGGSAEALKRETQAVADLELRLLNLRRGIQRANDQIIVQVGTNSMTVSDWLTWRRDVAPAKQAFMNGIRQRLHTLREHVKRTGGTVVGISASATVGENKPQDIVVNIDELALSRDIEDMEETLGALDGQLSLKNATVMIDV